MNYQIQLHSIDADGNQVELSPINRSDDVITGLITLSEDLIMPGSNEGETLTSSLSYIKKYLDQLGTVAKVKRDVSSATDNQSETALATSKAVYDVMRVVDQVKNDCAVKKHNSTGTEFGVASSLYYGHVKLSDTYNSIVADGAAADGLGASQNAVGKMYENILQVIKDSTNLDILVMHDDSEELYSSVIAEKVSVERIVGLNQIATSGIVQIKDDTTGDTYSLGISDGKLYMRLITEE